MKLQEFVSETLREIIAGVKDAQAYARDNDAEVNPSDESLPGERTPYTDTQVGGRRVLLPIKDIEFDVAVTSTDKSETQAGAGIFVAALSIGVKDKSDTLNSCVSRIRFSVPIVLPVQGKEL